MSRIITKIKKESLTTKLTLIIIGLTAGSGLLVPATYASFHPVTTGEIANDTIRSADISNSAGVQSVDIVNGQVGSVDIGNRQVARGDIQNDAIRPNIGINSASELVEVGTFEDVFVNCPAGTTLLTGGGYNAASFVEVYVNRPLDANTWEVVGFSNNPTTDTTLLAYIICIGPMP